MKDGLYIVATPIGNLDDISIRAINIIKDAYLIICENPNHSIKLLSKLGIKKKLISLHDHNENKIIKKIVKIVKNQKIVLISDAGSPLISDPGYKLVKHCIENDAFVTTVPGPTSLISALQLSTMPMNEFQFLGFISKTKKTMEDLISKSLNSSLTSVFFVSNHRIIKCLHSMSIILKNRRVCVCKEITKINEKRFVGSSSEVIDKLEKDPKNLLGEFVIIVEGNKKEPKLYANNPDAEIAITKLLEKFSLTDVVEIVHKISNIGKKDLYKKALELKNEKIN